MNLGSASAQAVMRNIYGGGFGGQQQQQPKRKAGVILPATSPPVPSVRVVRLLGPMHVNPALHQYIGVPQVNFADIAIPIDLDRMSRLFPSAQALLVSDNDPFPEALHVYSAAAAHAEDRSAANMVLPSTAAGGLSCPAALLRSCGACLGHASAATAAARCDRAGRDSMIMLYKHGLQRRRGVSGLRQRQRQR